jgi:hypothetical protein
MQLRYGVPSLMRLGLPGWLGVFLAGCGSPQTGAIDCAKGGQNGALSGAQNIQSKIPQLNLAENSLADLPPQNAARIQFSSTSGTFLILNDKLSESSSAEEFTERRCPTLVETEASAAQPVAKGLWISRDCLFQSAAKEMLLEFPAHEGMALRAFVSLPALERKKELSNKVPKNLMEEWNAVAQGGKKQELDSCTDMLVSPLEIPPAQSALYCYSLNEFSRFDFEFKEVIPEKAQQIWESHLSGVHSKKERAYQSLPASEARALQTWLTFQNFEVVRLKAALRLANRMHPSRCAPGFDASESLLCSEASVLEQHIRNLLGETQQKLFLDVLRAPFEDLGQAYTNALSQVQFLSSSSASPMDLVHFLERSFLAYQPEKEEFSAQFFPDFLQESLLRFSNGRFLPQSGVRGALLLGLPHDRSQDVYDPHKGGFFLTLSGVVPLGVLFSGAGDGGTEGTSGGIPLRPLPVAKPSQNGGAGTDSASRLPESDGKAEHTGAEPAKVSTSQDKKRNSSEAKENKAQTSGDLSATCFVM